MTDKYAGRLVEFSTLSLKARMDDIILSHRIVTVEMNGEKVQVGIDRVHNIVSNKVKLHKIGTILVPRKLARIHMHRRLWISTESKERYEREGEHFISKILTGDKTYYEPEVQYTNSPVKEKFKIQASVGKVIIDGVDFCDYLKERCTINS